MNRNFKMSNLDLEKTEEREIKLPISVSSLKQQDNSRKTSTYVSLMMLKPLTLLITTNWKTLRDGDTRSPYLPPDKLVCRLRSNS